MYSRPPAPDIWSRALTTSMGVAKAQVTTPATPPAISIANTHLHQVDGCANKHLKADDQIKVFGIENMTTLTRQDLNFGQVVADILCEFLEVAIHLILYVREVYPSGIFQKRKKYNVPVQNDAEKVVVVIMDKEHHPVERFVFEMSQPPLLSISSDTLLSHVEQLLRAFILKISVCDAVLNNNPPGCSFSVLVHTRDAATRNMEKVQVIKDFPWIVADEQEVHMQEPRLIPLKTMTSDIVKMQLYVEERAQKT
ncbi:hypothetical protein F7725_000377 [Dissostichus mawsoni]|uniref:HORMA domain-containing protein n=1 Tax=Dissostichus mawsoni TaxID=36200 RepID=A0A7J5ZE70_DISMA|nr:hypothetical protein F7725_000377 [Dissostichus mawsoni]